MRADRTTEPNLTFQSYPGKLRSYFPVTTSALVSLTPKATHSN